MKRKIAAVFDGDDAWIVQQLFPIRVRGIPGGDG